MSLCYQRYCVTLRSQLDPSFRVAKLAAYAPFRAYASNEQQRWLEAVPTNNLLIAYTPPG